MVTPQEKLKEIELDAADKYDVVCRSDVLWLIERVKELERGLERIKQRFDEEDVGGMPRAGMAWAMWCDAKEFLKGSKPQ